MEYLAENIAKVKKNIEIAAMKSGRKANEIKLIAVSKTVDIKTVAKALELGLSDFAENRVQELVHKVNAIPNAKWHMIGRLQTNKVKEVVGKVVLIHSLDRWNLAETLNSRAELLDTQVPVLLQVNISGEIQKAGVKPNDVKEFLKSAGSLQRIKILGFMTMAPQDENPENARPIFKELYNLKKNLSKETFENVDLKYLSMGMSQDYQVAIEEGANIVRVGSSIFGNR